MFKDLQCELNRISSQPNRSADGEDVLEDSIRTRPLGLRS